MDCKRQHNKKFKHIVRKRFILTTDVGKNDARLAYVLPQDDLERAIDVLGAAIIQYRKQYNL